MWQIGWCSKVGRLTTIFLVIMAALYWGFAPSRADAGPLRLRCFLPQLNLFKGKSCDCGCPDCHCRKSKRREPKMAGPMSYTADVDAGGFKAKVSGTVSGGGSIKVNVAKCRGGKCGR